MPKAPKLPPAVVKAFAQGAKVPQVGELIAHFQALAGGPEALAKMMYTEFVAAPAGSIIRQRILDTILRLTSAMNQQMGSLGDLEMLGTEDLERELERLLVGFADGAEAQAERPAGAARPG